MKIDQTRLFNVLLLCVVVGAIAVALSGLVVNTMALPADAIAAVNGHIIGREEFQRYLDEAEAQLRHPLTTAERGEVLARLIDEELLLQQGLALELPRKDSRLRSQLVQELIQQSVSNAVVEPVDAAALESFYDKHLEFFTRPASQRVSCYDFDGDHAAQTAIAAIESNQMGTDLDPHRNPHFPDGWMSEGKLRDYLGADVASRVAALAVGKTVAVPGEQGVIHVYLLMARQPVYAPPFADIRSLVESEYRRRHDEQALTEMVDKLRHDADIRFAETRDQ